MSGLCVAAAGVVATIVAETFTFGWGAPGGMRFEEDVRIEGDRLVVEEARIANPPPGFVPPEGAREEGGVWRYRPRLPSQGEIEVGPPSEAPGAQICAGGSCRALADVAPGASDGYVLSACPTLDVPDPGSGGG